jgi:hypothetical protein
MMLPETANLVIAAWVAAAWLSDKWDKFPHLAITSPEKRCGKTTLLSLLTPVVPRPLDTTNISPAALWRVVVQRQPTLLLDEAQSLARRGSESAEVLREVFNASIERNAKVIRCAGPNHDIVDFPIYCPKVIALIGSLDGVLADRSLPVEVSLKTDADAVLRYRSRAVASRGQDLSKKLQKWAEASARRAAAVYYTLEPFNIRNDRMADLLLPLQAVLMVSAGPGPGPAPDRVGLEVLQKYANALDARDREQEMLSPGVRLLAACRDIFLAAGKSFLPTTDLIKLLVRREEEPWRRWCNGEHITPEALANLLRPYGIKSTPDRTRKHRGYCIFKFHEAWERYLPPRKTPETPSNAPNPSSRPGKGGAS